MLYIDLIKNTRAAIVNKDREKFKYTQFVYLSL